MALQVDPGSAMVANNAAQGYGLLRDFAPAEALHARAAALSPDWSMPYFGRTRLYLRWDGNTKRARAVLEEARRVDVADAPLMVLVEVLVDVFDGRYEHAIDRLSSGAPEVIQDQFRFLPKTLLLAEISGLRQRHDLSRAYYDSARATIVRKLDELPDDSRLHSALGIAYAGLGRKAEAIRHGERAVQLLPISKEAYRGYYRAWDLARIYAMVGKRDAAVNQLEHLLSIPGDLTAAWLRLDPTWNTLRRHPRFTQLLRREK
jgi:serine/threonine-protein kinase